MKIGIDGLIISALPKRITLFKRWRVRALRCLSYQVIQHLIDVKSIRKYKMQTIDMVAVLSRHVLLITRSISKWAMCMHGNALPPLQTTHPIRYMRMTLMRLRNGFVGRLKALSFNSFRCDRDCSGKNHLWNALRAHSSVWLAILFTLCVCNLLISDRSMPQNQYIIFPHLRWLATKCVPFCCKIFFFSSIYFGNLSRCSFSCVFLKHFAWLFLVQKCTIFRFRGTTKKINGNKFKINAQCVNKNLRWNKILHLAWIQLSIYWNSLGYCLCVFAALRRHIRKGFWRCAGNYHYIVITRMQMDVGDINKN